LLLFYDDMQMGWLVVAELTGLCSRQWSKSRGGVGLINTSENRDFSGQPRKIFGALTRL